MQPLVRPVVATLDPYQLTLSRQALELLAYNGEYCVANLLIQALLHSECYTWLELVDVLFEEVKWPAVPLRDACAAASKHLPMVNQAGKIDPAAIVKVLVLGHVAYPREYKPEADKARLLCKKDYVLGAAGYLNRLYAKGTWLTGDLETDLRQHLPYIDTAPEFESMLQSCAPSGKLSQMFLQSAVRPHDLTLTRSGYADVDLMSYVREQLDYFAMIDGKPPLQVAELNVNRSKVKATRLQAACNRAQGPDLASARAAYRQALEVLAQAETKLVDARQVADTAAAEAARSNADLAANEAANGWVVSPFMAATHQLAWQWSERVSQAGNLPPCVIVGWTLRRIIKLLAPDAESGLVGEVVNALIDHGLTVLYRNTKPDHTIYRLVAGGFQPTLNVHPAPPVLAAELLENWFNSQVGPQNEMDLRVTFHHLKSYAPDLGLTDLFAFNEQPKQPVVAELIVEPAPVPIVITPELSSVTPTPEEVSMPITLPVAVTAPTAEPLADLPLLVSSPLKVEIYRVACRVMKALEEAGWKPGILTSKVLNPLVKMVYPQGLQPPVTVSEMSPDFFVRIKPGVYRLRHLRAQARASLARTVQPTLLTDERINELIASVLNPSQAVSEEPVVVPSAPTPELSTEPIPANVPVTVNPPSEEVTMSEPNLPIVPTSPLKAEIYRVACRFVAACSAAGRPLNTLNAKRLQTIVMLVHPSCEHPNNIVNSMTPDFWERLEPGIYRLRQVRTESRLQFAKAEVTLVTEDRLEKWLQSYLTVRPAVVAAEPEPELPAAVEAKAEAPMAAAEPVVAPSEPAVAAKIEAVENPFATVLANLTGSIAQLEAAKEARAKVAAEQQAVLDGKRAELAALEAKFQAEELANQAEDELAVRHLGALRQLLILG